MPAVLTKSAQEVLMPILDTHYLTTRQLAAILGRSEKSTNDHLRLLRANGLITTVPIPKGVFELGAKGMESSVQIATKDAYKLFGHAGSPRKPGKLLIHDLAVRDVYVWAAVSARSIENHSIEYWNCSGNKKVGDTIPDAMLSYQIEPGDNGRAARCLIEVDLGTERAISGTTDRWAQKITAYSAILSEQPRDTLFEATGWARIRMLVIVETIERVNWIVQRAHGSAMAKDLWITHRGLLHDNTVHSRIWFRPTTGEWTSFL